MAEIVNVDRLGEEVVSPQAGGQDGLTDAAVAGGDNDGEREAEAVDLADEVHTVQAGEAQVGDQEAEEIVLQEIEGGGAVGDEDDLKGGVLTEKANEVLAGRLVVLYHQHPARRLFPQGRAVKVWTIADGGTAHGFFLSSSC